MEGQYLCIVMDFVVETLKAKVEQRAKVTKTRLFKEFNVCWSLRTLSSALQYLHTLPTPILHRYCLSTLFAKLKNIDLSRNLKPDNILCVSEDARECKTKTSLKLGDIGLPKLLSKDTQMKFYASSIAGKFIYMAPEIVVDIQNAQYSWPADIWSLGETLALYANTCIVVKIILLGCVMAFICNHGKHLFKHSIGNSGRMKASALQCARKESV